MSEVRRLGQTPNSVEAESLQRQSSIVVERNPEISSIITVRIMPERGTIPPFSITRAHMEGLKDAFDGIAEQSYEDARVVILRGSGQGRRAQFGTGANFTEIMQAMDTDRQNGNSEATQAYWQMLNGTTESISRCGRPVITVIEGNALGAAYLLAMGGHLLVASDTAQIGIPAVQRNLAPGSIATKHLVGRVGATRAYEILLRGKIYSAQDAKEMGLINTVFPAEELEENILLMARELAEENGPLAMGEVIENIIMAMEDPGFKAADIAGLPIRWAGSDDTTEGVASFQEKRKPVFKGR